MNRFYVATARGLNYVDFDSGSVNHFTAADGLANDQVEMIFRDRRRAFWFGTTTGVSRLLPQTKERQGSIPIFINSLKIAGEAQRISEVGEIDLPARALAANQNHIEIGFGSLLFAGDAIRYQYRLEGADADWHSPTFQRMVNYANLAPGHYSFIVRAVNADGVWSETPASFSFTILPPIWQRWWFLALAATAIGLAVYALQRYRVGRLRSAVRSKLIPRPARACASS